jgi:hypothetical protein
MPYSTFMNQIKVVPVTYDRVEVLHFANGTQGKHCVKQVTVQPSRNRAPQPGWSYIREWQEINPEITYVHFEYMNPRCENFIKGA